MCAHKHLPETICVAASGDKYLVALGDGHFRTNIPGQICVDIVVCTSGIFGADFDEKIRDYLENNRLCC